jgi:hypothetical protein
MRSEGARVSRRFIVPLLVLIALAAGFLGGRTLPPDADPPQHDGDAPTMADAAAQAVDGTTPRAPGATPAPLPASRSTAAPLPPLDAPLRDVLPALEQRAREGDSAAAGRLALDIELCRQRPQLGHAIPFFEDAAARAEATSDDDVDFIARIEAIHRRAEQVCAGLDAAWIEDRGWRYMLQAAQRDARLAARYATSPPLDAGRFLEQPEAWQAYAAHAAHLLRWAGEQGDPRAWYFLQQAYSGRSTLRGMPNAIPADPARAAMMALVLRDFSDASTRRDLDDGLAALRETLGEARWAAIEAEADAQRSRHFAEQVPIDFDSGVYGDQDARICEEPAAR